jgi:uncharacterized protein
MKAPRRALSAAGLVLALVGPGVVAWLSTSGDGEPGTRAVMLMHFVALLAGVLSVAVFQDRAGRKELGFAKSAAFSLLFAVPLAAFFILVYGPAAYWSLDALNLPSFTAGADSFEDLPRWYFALAIILVAGGEEWLYRGYAIERLERMTGSPLLAASLSTFAFFLVHPPVWGVGPALTTLVSGGILAALYLWRRDVLMLMIAHIATDLYGLMAT